LATVVVAGLLISGGGWVYREANAAQPQPAAAQPPAKQPAPVGGPAQPPGGKDAAKKDGLFRCQIEKVDADERTVTAFRLGTLVGGFGGPKGGVGQFKNNIRLENLPVSKTASITINGKEAQLADLKQGMPVTLELEVHGDITVKSIRTAKE
jgi:hypothetical protein